MQKERFTFIMAESKRILYLFEISLLILLQQNMKYQLYITSPIQNLHSAGMPADTIFPLPSAGGGAVSLSNRMPG
jgi:hypothetical protein